MYEEQVKNLLKKASSLEVKHTQKIKNLITGTVLSQDKSIYYTPTIDLEEMVCSCGCVNNGVNDKVCKHIVAVLLEHNMKNIVVKLLAKKEEERCQQNLDI